MVAASTRVPSHGEERHRKRDISRSESGSASNQTNEPVIMRCKETNSESMKSKTYTVNFTTKAGQRLVERECLILLGYAVICPCIDLHLSPRADFKARECDLLLCQTRFIDCTFFMSSIKGFVSRQALKGWEYEAVEGRVGALGMYRTNPGDMQ